MALGRARQTRKFFVSSLLNHFLDFLKKRMKYFFANWKMYLNLNASRALIHDVVEEPYDAEGIEVALFPTALAFHELENMCANTSLRLGAQNVSWVPKGAYTGAISALLYKEAGATYALVGHSERRYIFGESDSDIRKKLEACLDVGLIPVLCIGETKEDVAEGKRQYRLKKQLFTAFDGLDLGNQRLCIAYEPVWAIGTGNPCQPSDVEDVHEWIRGEITQYSSLSFPILYGGSVDPENVGTYTTLESVDGVLVGSASTKIGSFQAILSAIDRSQKK